jgi:trans-2,3-dihydro-3-hydroxyanthranilate isomerase
MRRRYAIANVFTDRMFSGNPVAVVLDAEDLTAAQMQAIAIEFNHSETTFVLPPRDPAHTAWVRIFTPSREVPFAGHPNIGTAFVLAGLLPPDAVAPGAFMFEEAAGLVPITLLRDDAAITGAELAAPEPLSRHSAVDPARAAACLSLAVADLRTDTLPPGVASVGLPFLFVELATRDALRRARPDRTAYDALLPLDGATAVYAYTQDVEDFDVQSRMFTPRMTEDPATGSAAAALATLLADVRGADVLPLRVGQGLEMGRPSILLARAQRRGGALMGFVGGGCVAVMDGTLRPLAGEGTFKG